MVSVKTSVTGNPVIAAFALVLAVTLSGCLSSPSKKEDADEDIYAALRDDDIEYRDERQVALVNDTSPEFVREKIDEIRSLFFQKDYAKASEMAEGLVRQAPQNPEVYYWLSRVRLEVGDYQQAYEMASKGVSLSGKGSSLKAELERLQRQAQLGAR
ncbi:Uncharacterised protein [BD1-7 clade bacterium]|uniref:Beta-barrel assembly-enhancing protease n=1 Tax=BD1-7 clade bacterium TaxID=2029982 RepID=A0A5S9Q8J8_9GAMM|nr:Uncharacterised protein [BD1-7 clade bacterium]